jgi:hypothetical protein
MNLKLECKYNGYFIFLNNFKILSM